jgi:hypothetical protein
LHYKAINQNKHCCRKGSGSGHHIAPPTIRISVSKRKLVPVERNTHSSQHLPCKQRRKQSGSLSRMKVNEIMKCEQGMNSEKHELNQLKGVLNYVKMRMRTKYSRRTHEQCIVYLFWRINDYRQLKRPIFPLLSCRIGIQSTQTEDATKMLTTKVAIAAVLDCTFH